MKIRAHVVLPPLLAAFVGVGCIPYHYTLRPSASGKVVDARTGAPVTGASVSVAPADGDNPAGRAITGADGSFLVAPLRQWGAYFFVTDCAPAPFTLSVQQAGYRQKTMPFDYYPLGRPTATNLGTLRLESTTGSGKPTSP